MIAILLPLFVRDDTSCVIFAIEPICFSAKPGCCLRAINSLSTGLGQTLSDPVDRSAAELSSRYGERQGRGANAKQFLSKALRAIRENGGEYLANNVVRPMTVVVCFSRWGNFDRTAICVAGIKQRTMREQACGRMALAAP